MPDAYTLGGAAIQGSLGLIGSAMQYGFNKRLAAQQNQYNIDMWNMQNEYNSPQAQMQRFQDAGLNPNLIYGQGNNGNNSNAPQMVAPEAPRVDRAMENLGKAFHLEQLRKLHWEAEAAKENADAQFIANQNARDERGSMYRLQNLMYFNTQTGRYEYMTPDVTITRDPNKAERRIRDRSGAYQTETYRFNKFLSDRYKELYPLSSVSYRNAYLEAQRKLIVPQIWMKEFDRQHYPETFYVDRAKLNNPAGLIYGLWDKGLFDMARDKIYNLFH